MQDGFACAQAQAEVGGLPGRTDRPAQHWSAGAASVAPEGLLPPP
jgi:hypothetical protein